MVLDLSKIAGKFKAPEAASEWRDEQMRSLSARKLSFDNPNEYLDAAGIEKFLSTEKEGKTFRQIVSDPEKRAELDAYAQRLPTSSTLPAAVWRGNRSRILHYLKTGHVLPKAGRSIPVSKLPEDPEACLSRFLELRDRHTITYFDTETTGLAPETGDTVIQFYGLRTFRGEKVSEILVHVKPYKNSVGDSLAIHSITEKTLSEKGLPPMEGLRKIREFLDESPLAFGHNVSFDAKMLEHMYNDWGMDPHSAEHFDTIDIFKNVVQKRDPSVKRLGLSYLIPKILGEKDPEPLLPLIERLGRIHGNREAEDAAKKIEKKLFLGLSSFVEEERATTFLTDHLTDELAAIVEKRASGAGILHGDVVRAGAILEAKLRRRHNADYDAIQTFRIVEKAVSTLTGKA